MVGSRRRCDARDEGQKFKVQSGKFKREQPVSDQSPKVLIQGQDRCCVVSKKVEKSEALMTETVMLEPVKSKP